MSGNRDEGIPVTAMELMIFLNELYLRGGDINLSYPFYNIHLMTLAQEGGGYVIKRPVDRQSFTSARKAHMPRGEFFEGDLPIFNDLREAYVVSGLIPYPNLQEIYSQMVNFRMMEERSMKSVFFAPDTNTAYLRFFTRNFPARVDRAVLSMERFRFVVSDLVRWELDNMVKQKYSGQHIRKMSDRLSKPHLVQGFINASTRRSRRAKDALVELHSLRRRYGSVKAVAGEGEVDKEDRDISIAESYSAFQKRENAYVVMVTADKDMISHAMSRELDHLFIKYPPEYVPDREPKDPWSVANMIYTIAVRMGALSIENHGIDIVGEWYGKDMDAYNREMVMIRFNENSEARAEFTRDLRIAEKISSVIGEVRTGGETYG